MKPMVFAVCLVTFVQQADATTDSCEIYRQNFYTAEYGDKCYVYPMEGKSWYGAKESCETSGGRLARLENKEQYDYVMNGENYYDKDGKVSFSRIVVAWIDGQRQYGKLYWSDAKQPTPLKTNAPPSLTSAIASITEGTTTVHTDSRDQPNADRLYRQKSHTVSKIRHYGVFINATPLFEHKAHTVTMCSRACTSLHGCILFNFNPESGECRGYTDKDETYMEEKKIWQLWTVG